MTYLCVGGEHEAMTLETAALQYTFYPVFDWETEETYVRISAKNEGEFFMLAGMKPVDALKRYRELTGKPTTA